MNGDVFVIAACVVLAPHLTKTQAVICAWVAVAGQVGITAMKFLTT
jgi:hypothetical protein